MSTAGEPRRGYFISELSTDQFAALIASGPVVVLVPVGSVEPHGPHLTLTADTVISKAVALQAVSRLCNHVIPVIAPSVPYGVTEYAHGFAGAVSIPGAALAAFLRAIVEGFLGAGVRHVCLINNHLEPAQDLAVRTAIEGLDHKLASVACPLDKRWARTLSDEFKRGDCHAGRYETSILMAYDPRHVDEQIRAALPAVPISLADGIKRGLRDFQSMGIHRAYCGSPADATVQEGEEQIEKLATMVAMVVLESMEL